MRASMRIATIIAITVLAAAGVTAEVSPLPTAVRDGLTGPVSVVVTKRAVLGSDAEPIVILVEEYDAGGHKRKALHFDPLTRKSYEIQHTYNADTGLLTRARQEIGGQRTVEYTSAFTYNSDGTVRLEVVTRGDGRFRTSFARAMSYDDDGRPIRVDVSGHPDLDTQLQEHDPDGKSSGGWTLLYGSVVGRHVQSVDDKGNVRMNESLDGDGAPSRRSVYNERGHVIQEEHYVDSGWMRLLRLREYEYDDRGNWVSCVEHNYERQTHELRPQMSWVYTREIGYRDTEE